MLEHDSPQEPLDLALPRIPLDEVPPLGTPYTNSNPWFNRLGASQEITFGEWETWYKGGPAPMTGASGQAQCDGWTHRHKMGPTYIRSVIANYCDTRRCFYENAPHRQYGPPYPSAGRPDGWTPELVNSRDPRFPDDNPDGSVTRPRPDGKPLQVTSLDVEHFWLNPLFELVDDDMGVEVDTPLGAKFPTNVIARVVVIYYMRSLAGQIRDPIDPVLPVTWQFGDRANSRVLNSYIEAALRPGCIELLDATTLDLWVRSAMLPFYESGAGISDFRKSGTPYTNFTIGTFNGLGWILSVCYHAAENLPASTLKDRLMTLVSRWSQWVLDIEMKWPGAGLAMSRVHVDREVMLQGPHQSLAGAGLIDNATAEWGGGAWEHYTFRAAHVAARVTDSPILEAQYQRKLTEFSKTTDPDLRVWLVDADGNPVT